MQREVDDRPIQRAQFEELARTKSIREYIIIKKEGDHFILRAITRNSNEELELQAVRKGPRTWKRILTVIEYIESIDKTPINIRIKL